MGLNSYHSAQLPPVTFVRLHQWMHSPWHMWVCSLPARGFYLAISNPLGRQVLVEWTSVDWIQGRCGHRDTPRLWYRRGATLLECLHERGKQKTCYGSRWPPCYGQRLLVWKALLVFNYERGWIHTTPSST